MSAGTPTPTGASMPSALEAPRDHASISSSGSPAIWRRSARAPAVRLHHAGQQLRAAEVEPDRGRHAADPTAGYVLRMPEEPDYKVYRSRPRLLKGSEEGPADGLQELRDEAPDAPRQPGAKPEYTVHRRRRFACRARICRGAITGRRVVKWMLTAAAGWILLSLVLFMVWAWIQRKNTSEARRSTRSRALATR